jgi:hypothetical protein
VLRRGEFSSFSDLVRLAVAKEIGQPPILPETRERLDALAVLLSVSPDSALRMLLDRYADELQR